MSFSFGDILQFDWYQIDTEVKSFGKNELLFLFVQMTSTKLQSIS